LAYAFTTSWACRRPAAAAGRGSGYRRREGKFKAKTGGSYGNEIFEYCPFVKNRKKKKVIYFKIFKKKINSI
jgi:hypothetical protein